MDQSPTPQDRVAEGFSVVMYELSARLPNKTLKVLSKSQYWNDVSNAAKSQLWWKERVLIGLPLQDRRGNWAGVYRDLEKNGIKFSSKHNYYNDIIVPVLYEIGADPTRNLNQLIVRSVEADSIGCLKLLLKDGRVHPGSLDNYAIRRAVELAQLEMVKLLLADPRVDASSSQNEAVKTAATFGFVEIFNLLIQDKKVRAVEVNSLENSYFLTSAIQCKQTEIVSIILEEDTVEVWSSHVEEAIKSGSVPMLKLLLSRMTGRKKIQLMIE